jgi:hypothetical protein
MKETIRLDIIKILKETLDRLNSSKYEHLSEISNHTIHNATLFQDKDSTSVAVIVYSLSKIFQKPEYQVHKEIEKFKQEIMKSLEKAKMNLMKMDTKAYESNTKDIIQAISKIDNQFGFYITHVISKAKLTKSSKVYEHGLSAGKAAELLGVSNWELMGYIGNTKIVDIEDIETLPERERMKLARRLFNLH